MRLQHKASRKHLWVGSAHLPNNEPREEINRLADTFFKVRGCDQDQAFAMGDFKTQFKWAEVAGRVVSGEMSAKWGDLRRIAMDAGFDQLTPGVEQLHIPTFHSRKGNVTNTQIDGGFVSNTPVGLLRVETESRREVGTDHDRVGVQGWVTGAAPERVVVGGPRVTGVAPDIPEVSHGVLVELARHRTKPASLGPKFKASAAVNTLRDMARRSRRSQSPPCS